MTAPLDELYDEDAAVYLATHCPDDVRLFCVDPPYCNITREKWDVKRDCHEHVDWLMTLFDAAWDKAADGCSLVVFQGVGKHGSHPIFELVTRLEEKWTYQNWVTWKKRRAYGKKDDYLFCREEMLWFTKGDAGFTFNVPLLDVKRGYAGYDKAHPAKSEYKRVSNVWDDINELFRPTFKCEKPVRLMERLVTTHSAPGDVVVDFFAGAGATRVAALNTGRGFSGCELDSARHAHAASRTK